MYYQYFGLSEAPFSIAVNPRYLFMSPRHRDALAHLLYGVGAGGGFILLTGEVGTGKTTINRCLLEQLPDDTDIAIILNPALNAMELLATVCDELGIDYDRERHTLKTLTDNLHRFLLENHGRGRKTVLLIDEAQHLDFDVLEQVRLLTNLETHSEKLLQIILIGQPELAQMLGRPELRQLNQRITARYNLEALSLEETGAYIRHRLQVAGMSAGREVFPPAVVRGIHRHTRGIPRLINVLCDRILLGAYGRNRERADQAMLRIAAAEVLGDGAGEERREAPRWRAPAALALVALVAAVLLGWWGLGYSPARPPVPVAGEMVAVPVGPMAEPEPAPQEPGGAESAPLASTPAGAGPQAVTPAADDLGGEDVVAPDSRDWLLSPADARARWWGLYSAAPPPPGLCTGPATAGLACVEESARTWDDLADFDRPLLLELVTPERFAAAVVYLGASGKSAWLEAEEGVVAVDLAELGPMWTGSYHFLWHPPPGFTRPLGLGDNSPVVARIAGLFAQLDGQPRPLAADRFNQALQQRVRLFQREHGIEDDGFVGMQTLLKLNEALGIDPRASGLVALARADGAPAGAAP